MPYSIDITGVSGGTAPINYYVCDQNGNNCTFLGTTIGTYVLPIFYQNATTLLIQSIDSGGCYNFKLYTCVDTCFILTEDLFAITAENGDNLTFCD
jgi:hypothetical protein